MHTRVRVRACAYVLGCTSEPCMCMPVCAYVGVYTCVHMGVCVHVCTHLSLCTPVCAYVGVYSACICVHVCMCACTHLCARAHRPLCMCVHVGPLHAWVCVCARLACWLTRVRAGAPRGGLAIHGTSSHEVLLTRVQSLLPLAAGPARGGGSGGHKQATGHPAEESMGASGQETVEAPSAPGRSRPGSKAPEE